MSVTAYRGARLTDFAPVTRREAPEAQGHESCRDVMEDLMVVMSRRDMSGAYLQVLTPPEVRQLARVTRACSLACC